MEEYRIYSHTPPHLYRPGAKYFITASIYGHKKLLDEQAKEKLLSSLQQSCRNHGWTLDDWVFLDDHYHIMATAPKKNMNLPAFIGEYHRFTAMFIKKINHGIVLPKIFQNYWDSCITYENSYYVRLNYIYYNPVKHGYVSVPEGYPWGSYHLRIRTERDYLDRLLKEYPFDSITVQEPY